MAVVRNHAERAKGSSAAAERRRLVHALETARAELGKLEANGHGERFGARADQPSVMTSECF